MLSNNDVILVTQAYMRLAALCNHSNTDFEVPVVSLALQGGSSLDVVSGLKSIIDDVSLIYPFNRIAFNALVCGIWA
jgi:hypothetical protein